jgi:hypothetical protein
MAIMGEGMTIRIKDWFSDTIAHPSLSPKRLPSDVQIHWLYFDFFHRVKK